MSLSNICFCQIGFFYHSFSSLDRVLFCHHQPEQGKKVIQVWSQAMGHVLGQSPWPLQVIAPAHNPLLDSFGSMVVGRK